MKGIADGASDAGAKWQGRRIDLIDIVTANTIVEMGELRAALPMTPTGLEALHLKSPQYAEPRRRALNERCSAFAATGKATKDGKMIVAHTTWWPLTLAEQTNVMLDIQPVKGPSAADAELSGRNRERHGLVSERCGRRADGDHHPPESL